MPKTNKLTAEIDLYIGQAIKTARLAQDMSQTALGKALGVTFQQVQKQEAGTNRLSTSAFVIVCKTLGINPMDILGPLVGEQTEAGRLAAQVVSLKQQIADMKANVEAALK